MWNPFARFQRIRTPDKAQLNDIALEVDFTPDVATLEMKKFIPIFEYGECMTERKLYKDLLSSSACLGTAFTVDSKFRMATNFSGKHPIVLEEKPDPNHTVLSKEISARIKGEIHIAHPQVLFDLDRHRLNGIQFQRVRIPVDIPHHKVLEITDVRTGHTEVKITGQLHKVVSAWTYIGIKEFWETRLDGGYKFPSARLIRPDGRNSKPFYYFEGK